MANHIYGHAMAATINPVLENIDIDGVVSRIDIDELVKRIDIDDVVKRIDINAVVERIDIEKVVIDRINWNDQLSRIDFNVLLQSININDIIVQRTDIPAIITQSTTSIITTFLDYLRLHIVQIDLSLHYMIRFHWMKKRRHKKRDRRRKSKGHHHDDDNDDTITPSAPTPSPSPPQPQSSRYFIGSRLPPRPGQTKYERHIDYCCYPEGKYQKSIAVQGRYTGFVAKAVAILLDFLIITLSFAIGIIILKLCYILFLNETRESITQHDINKNTNTTIYVFYCMYWFLYFFLSVAVTGWTIGMGMVGIQVVNSSTGSLEDITTFQILIRTLLLPLSTTFFPPLAIFGGLRRDGRMLHDYIANTGIVYCWEAHLAMLRKQAAIQFQQRQYDAYMKQQQAQQQQQQRVQTLSTSSHDSTGSDDSWYRIDAFRQGDDSTELLLSEHRTTPRQETTYEYSTFNDRSTSLV